MLDRVAAFVAVTDGDVEHHDSVDRDPDPGDGTTLRTERWERPDGVVAVLHTVVGGGHTPLSGHAPIEESFGPISRDLDASAEAVAFVVGVMALDASGGAG